MTAASLVLAASAAGAPWLAQAGFTAAAGLPMGWTHAEINYYVRPTAHTLILDRGTVTQASPAGITIREQDGSSVQVALSSTTQVMVDGTPGSLNDIRRGVWAMTSRIDGGAATAVRIHVPPRLARTTRP